MENEKHATVEFISKDSQPLMEAPATRASEFIKRSGLSETRKFDEKFEDFLQKMNYVDFRGYLTRLNGVLRDIPIAKRSIDGQNVEVSSLRDDEVIVNYLPPPEDLKDDLMREGFESIKSLADNDDRALLAFYLIQYLHPYADGNGRTGRLLYKIISEDGKNIDDNEMYALLNHDSNSSVEHGAGRDVFANEVLDAQKASYYINRELAKDVLGDDFVKNNGEIYLTASLGYSFIPERERSLMSEPDIKLVESILQENGTVAFPFNGLVLAKVLQQNDSLQRYGYNLMIKTGPERGASILPEDSGKNIFGIYAEDFMDDLDSTTINQLINTHRSLKVKSIETLIDIFVHPDKHQVMGPDGNQVPIKDIFDTELKKQLGL